MNMWLIISISLNVCLAFYLYRSSQYVKGLQSVLDMQRRQYNEQCELVSTCNADLDKLISSIGKEQAE